MRLWSCVPLTQKKNKRKKEAKLYICRIIIWRTLYMHIAMFGCIWFCQLLYLSASKTPQTCFHSIVLYKSFTLRVFFSLVIKIIESNEAPINFFLIIIYVVTWSSFFQCEYSSRSYVNMYVITYNIYVWASFAKNSRMTYMSLLLTKF